MRLYGYQCDNCGKKSKDLHNVTWYEVKSMHIRGEEISFMGAHLMSEGNHYCSRECLKEAIDKWPKR